MGLLDFLRRLLFPRPAPPARSNPPQGGDGRMPARDVAEGRSGGSGRTVTRTVTQSESVQSHNRGKRLTGRRGRKVQLAPLRRPKACDDSSWEAADEVDGIPYRFARFGVRRGGYLDLSKDGDEQHLTRLGLPVFRTPEELAAWLEIPLGKLAWLIHRFADNSRPPNEKEAHYHFRWVRKRSGGWRLIESPKATLKEVQGRILEEILNQVPAHAAAHGFVPGRSIVSNAEPHTGKAVLVRYDLADFYPTVTRARVTAIFRTLGYSREAAVWLGRLCTSSLPQTIAFPGGEASGIRPYLRAHLPQGAPTSPALANLSAFSLDVRLSGLARSFGATYTRYADDLTFSGPAGFHRALPTFLPLVDQIIRNERFRANHGKRRVVQRQSRQMVTGVVVNRRTNVRRDEFDRLKAVLTNCVRHGAQTQNRENRDDFAQHLRGRIAHVQLLNVDRGAKLLALYEQIDWRKPAGK